MSLVLSPERFILSSLEEQVRFLREQDTEPYSLGIEFGIAELVRMRMRELAQVNGEREVVILERSLETVEAKLNEWCAQTGLIYNFTPYFSGVRKGLKFAAREISELSRQLALSRQSERVASRERILDRFAIPVEIVQVGLRNAIESLIAIPLAEEFELDLEGARQVYEFQGRWFPYQVSIEPFDLLLDDDGTILVATVSLSETSVWRAREALLTLAEQLYRPSLSQFS